VKQRSLFDSPDVERVGMGDVQLILGDCQRCRLSKSRNKIVFGSGNQHAKLMFIGEAPGEFEDVTGLPFVGKAGVLLAEIFTANKITRDEVYIANVLKCRPPGNRNPADDEVAECRPFLELQIKAIEPRVIVALGKFASAILTGHSESVHKLRGKVYPYKPLPGVRVITTFHPAYVLRNGVMRKELEADIWLAIEEARRG